VNYITLSLLGVENELYPHDYVGMQSNGIMDNVYVAAQHPYCHAAAVIVEVLQAPVIIVAVVVVKRMI
jgi:hypothetical protein